MNEGVEPEGSGSAGDTLVPTHEALAVVVTALEQYLVTASRAPGASGPSAPGWRTASVHPWRFSGRSWSGPAPLRRDRPRR